MDIFISQNNRQTVVQLPVVPPEFNVSLDQNHENFNSISQGDLRLIGDVGLKGISFSSFFPLDNDNNAPYIRSTQWFGHTYVDIFEAMMKRKLPVRLTITDTKINLPMTIDKFDYTVGKSGDVDYTMTLTEFRFVKVKGAPKV